MALGYIGQVLCSVVKCWPASSCAISSADIMQWCAPFLLQQAGSRDSGVSAAAESAARSGRAKAAINRMEMSLRKQISLADWRVLYDKEEATSADGAPMPFVAALCAGDVKQGARHRVQQ